MKLSPESYEIVERGTKDNSARRDGLLFFNFKLGAVCPHFENFNFSENYPFFKPKDGVERTLRLVPENSDGYLGPIRPDVFAICPNFILVFELLNFSRNIFLKFFQLGPDLEPWILVPLVLKHANVKGI